MFYLRHLSGAIMDKFNFSLHISCIIESELFSFRTIFEFFVNKNLQSVLPSNGVWSLYVSAI